jgi:hypothetical protein
MAKDDESFVERVEGACEFVGGGDVVGGEAAGPEDAVVRDEACEGGASVNDVDDERAELTFG